MTESRLAWWKGELKIMAGTVRVPVGGRGPTPAGATRGASGTAGGAGRPGAGRGPTPAGATSARGRVTTAAVRAAGGGGGSS